MTKEKSEYILLKLRSGEEIIGRRVSAKRGHTGLERPLQINKSSIIDPHSGEIRKNICVLRDWMEFAVETRCEIPNDSILFSNTPTPEVVQRYKHELDRQDINAEVLKSLPDSELNKIMDDIEKVEKAPIDPLLARLMRMGEGANPKPNPQDQILNDMLNKMTGQKPQMWGPPPGAGNQGAITITMSIPPDVFMNILFNLPMFDGIWGEELPEDEDGDDDDDEGDQPKPPPPPKGQAPKGRKPKKDKDDEPPSNGWHGRFGFPK